MCNLEPFGFCMVESDLNPPSLCIRCINVTTQGRNYQLKKALSQVCLGWGPENKLNSFQIIKKV